jgi:hypothetical protein
MAAIGALALVIGVAVSRPVGAIVAIEYLLSGAIFTTNETGTEVNANIYPAKDDVYLDGGPGIGAPITAAGLGAGTWVFQVTDPSGKTLLSTDAAKCRRVTVAGGIITGVVVTGGCEHKTGVDQDHGATTVQLMPFNDSPNNGDEYKAWLTPEEAYLSGCTEHGINNGLDVVDCLWSGGNDHGFVTAHSKTDNFKVGDPHNTEIDVQFINDTTGIPMDGVGLRWIDTLGASNRKWSYYKPEVRIDHYAHIEAPEVGTHKVVIFDQPGCSIYEVHTKDKIYKGANTVPVVIKKNDREWTKYMYVYCKP